MSLFLLAEVNFRETFLCRLSTNNFDLHTIRICSHIANTGQLARSGTFFVRSDELAHHRDKFFERATLSRFSHFQSSSFLLQTAAVLRNCLCQSTASTCFVSHVFFSAFAMKACGTVVCVAGERAFTLCFRFGNFIPDLVSRHDTTEITTARRGVITPNRNGAECFEADSFPFMSRHRVLIIRRPLLAVKWQLTTRGVHSPKIGVACRPIPAMDPAQVGSQYKAQASRAAQVHRCRYHKELCFDTSQVAR